MLKKKFILNFAPTGVIPTKEMTPYVPITPDEIVEDVLRVAGLGITMVLAGLGKVPKLGLVVPS